MNISRQYSGIKDDQSPKKQISPDKIISRQIGGMKAQGSNSLLVDINGSDVSIPKMEYVNLLEMQVKELREKIMKLEKQLITTNNRLQRLGNIQKTEATIKRY